MTIKKLIAQILVLFFCVSATSLQATNRFHLSAYDPKIPSELTFKLRPVIDLVQKVYSKNYKKKYSFKLHSPNDFKYNLDLIVEGKVDFARLSTFEYVLASNKIELQPFAIEMKNNKRTSTYAFIVHAESSFTTLKNLKNISVAFLRRRSIAGKYIPQLILRNNKIRKKHLVENIYSGTSINSIFSVMRKRIDLAVIKLSDIDLRDYPSIRVIHHYEAPNNIWAAKTEFNRSLLNNLKEAFSSVNAPETFGALGIDSIKAFEEKDTNLYADSFLAWKLRNKF